MCALSVCPADAEWAPCLLKIPGKQTDDHFLSISTHQLILFMFLCLTGAEDWAPLAAAEGSFQSGGQRSLVSYPRGSTNETKVAGDSYWSPDPKVNVLAPCECEE